MTNKISKNQKKNTMKENLRSSRLRRLEVQLKSNIAKRKKVNNKNG